MQKSIYMMLSLLAVGVVGSTSQATQRIGLIAQAAIPTGANDLNQSNNVGSRSGLYYLRDVTPNLSFGGEFNYFYLPSKNHRQLSANGGEQMNRATAQTMTFEAIGRYNISPEAKWNPYVQGGVGLARYHQTTRSTPDAGSAWADTGTNEERTIARDTSTSYALSGTIGVERALTDSILLGLDGTWDVWGVSHSKFGTDTINIPSVGLKLSWKY